MKRLCMIALTLLITAMGWSQDRMKTIREQYASALEGVKEQRSGDVAPQANMDLKFNRMEPAMGLVKYEQELYLMTNPEYCAFMREKRTAGPYEPTVTEALYDSNGQVMFCFRREAFTYDVHVWYYEERFYWNEDGSLLKVLRKANWDNGKNRPLTPEDFESDPNYVKEQCETFYQEHAPRLVVPDVEDE